jgi:hypothetical protein
MARRDDDFASEIEAPCVTARSNTALSGRYAIRDSRPLHSSVHSEHANRVHAGNAGAGHTRTPVPV